mmetsp:Transcript_5482/g.6734  ORF Transcript_5482/g.6734 Transcript_5482/m.6734 type:complete len:572 (+) Transcript_5482:228-1943(+)
MTTFDVEGYISRYPLRSETRLQRLLFIAESCASNNNNNNSNDNSNSNDESSASPSCISNAAEVSRTAWQLVEHHLKSVGNVRKYQQIFGLEEETVNPIIPNSLHKSDAESSSSSAPRHDIQLDHEFITRTTQLNRQTFEQLSNRLSVSQSQLSKDGICAAYTALSEHHLLVSCNPRDALRCALRSRDFCVTSNDSLGVLLRIAEVGVWTGQWGTGLTYAGRGEHAAELGGGNGGSTGGGAEAPVWVVNRLKIVSGVCLLHEGRYADAARKFAGLPEWDGSSSNNNSSHGKRPSTATMVSSSYDVALYAGILGLASLDRNGLTTLLESNGMKQRLEQIPSLRDALRAYQRAEYGVCLTQLHPDTGLRASMVLDVHLSSHVPTLIGMIRDRCIVQYCLPYLSVNLESMARRLCFTSGNGGTSTNGVEELEEAVEQLILRGRMKARINGQLGTLTTEFDEQDLNAIQTNKLTRKVDRMGDRFVQNVQSKLLRMNCREMGLTVGVQPREFDAPNSRAHGRGSGSSAAEGDYVEYGDNYHSDDMGIEGDGSGEDMDTDAEVASAIAQGMNVSPEHS